MTHGCRPLLRAHHLLTQVLISISNNATNHILGIRRASRLVLLSLVCNDLLFICWSRRRSRNGGICIFYWYFSAFFSVSRAIFLIQTFIVDHHLITKLNHYINYCFSFRGLIVSLSNTINSMILKIYICSCIFFSHFSLCTCFNTI